VLPKTVARAVVWPEAIPGSPIEACFIATNDTDLVTASVSEAVST
jgi:hypothetical protein